MLAGLVEATELGNVLIQAHTTQAPPASVEQWREIVTTSHAPVRYEPR